MPEQTTTGEMDSTSTRRRFLVYAGTAGVTGLTGCGGQSSTDGGDGAGGGTATDQGMTDTGTEADTETDGDTETDTDTEGGGTLRLADQPVGVMDPPAGKGGGGDANQIFETLLAFENGDLPPVGRLATDYQVSEDGTTFRFTLKEGVTFHNGDEFTADDVVYSWRRLAESPKTRNSDDITGDTFNIKHETDSDGNIVPDTLALRAVDDYTFEFELSRPFHSALVQIAGQAFSVIPEGIVGDIEGYDGEMSYEQWANEALYGTGPFQFDTLNRGSSYTFTRYDDYHGEVANVEAIEYTILEDPSAKYNRAMNGNLDIFEIPISEYDPSKVSIKTNNGEFQEGTYGPARNGETLQYGQVTQLNTQYLVFQTARVDRPVRRAIAYAMNQHTVANDIFKGVGQPAYHVTPPPVYPGGPEAYTQHAKRNYPWGYNESLVQEGRKLMEEAGYGPNNMYEVELLHMQTNAYEQFAELLRDQARAMHIDMTIESTPFSTMINRAVEGNFDIFTNSDGMEWPESDNFLRYFHSTASKESSFARWGQEGRRTDATRAFNKAWQKYLNNPRPTEADQKARNEAYIQLEEAHWRGIAQLPTIHGRGQQYWYDHVENFRMYGPMGNQRYNKLSLNR
ncbi:MAG: ABC transporter substrate-binding protein [Halobacteriales archaeon]|nr:ABC transporter substrate-binding protein [Halobacteriales archaeon]